MALTHISKVFAVKDCKIRVITADPEGGATTVGTSIDVPGIKKVKISGSVESKNLRGDNTLLDSDSVLTGIEVELEHAKLSLDVLAALHGSTVTDTGVTPAQIAEWELVSGDKPVPFELEAVSASADPIGGDVRFMLRKVVLSSFPDLGLEEEDYQTHSVKGNSMPRLSDGKWIAVGIRETAAAIV